MFIQERHDNVSALGQFVYDLTSGIIDAITIQRVLVSSNRIFADGYIMTGI